jgi:hypothetical protein
MNGIIYGYRDGLINDCQLYRAKRLTLQKMISKVLNRKLNPYKIRVLEAVSYNKNIKRC